MPRVLPLSICFALFLVESLLCQPSARADSPSQQLSNSSPEATGRDRFAHASRHIDGLLLESMESAGVQPAAQSGDAEFCRRVWLDLAGVAPPVWQLRAFLADSSPDKRARLIDELLDSSRFATHLANRWNEMLLPADTLEQGQENVGELHQWLRKQFLEGTPYDHIVGGFLTAGGESDRGPAIFYTSRDLEPVKLAGATSRLFLGIQLECAQCHDHPFARWSQDDFWSYAAFFSQLELNDSRMRASQTISDRVGREVTFPESDRVMPPRYPGVSEPPEPDPTDFRRRQLTIWLASRNNPYFARAAANRVWAHLFGRGLIDPVDAMDKDNPASHPQVLQYLADYFVEHRFDLRALYKVLALTDAYGRTSAVTGGERPPEELFAAMNIKTLSATQYFDSLKQNVLLGSHAATDGIRNQFVSRMQAPGASPVDYPHGIVQVLGLMNGPEMLAATGEGQSGLISSLDAPFFSDPQRVETVFLACLSRRPTDAESKMFLDFLVNEQSEASRADRLSDLTWILLNTAECFVCP